MSLLYQISLHLLALFSMPKFVSDYFVKKKYRKSFRSRFGRGFPQVKKEGRPLIWIHAVSVGETKAIATLAKRIKGHHSHPKLLLTCVTETGFDEGEKSIPEADYHAYLPFDFSYIIRPIVRKIKPEMVLLSEGDYWLNFLKEAKKEGASLMTVSGKISERSCRRLSRFSFFANALFSPMDRLFLQSEIYANRFRTLGLSAEKMKVTGNIKLDASSERVDPAWQKKLGIETGDLVVTFGSTHEPEEKTILSSLKPLWSRFPQLKVLIVPRHPERFDRVAALLDEENLSYGRWSKRENCHDRKIILIDAMGLLKECYSVSSLAFVGGSLTSKVGGHNIVEPCFYGVPALFGPHLQSQRDLQELVLGCGAGIEVEESTLTDTLKELLSHPEKREKMGGRGRQLVEEVKGSNEATWKVLLPFLDNLPKK